REPAHTIEPTHQIDKLGYRDDSNCFDFATTSSLSRAQRPDTRRAIPLCRVQWQKSWLTAPTSACRRRGWSSACNNARERGELLRPPQAAASLARRTCPFQ